jgi:serine/threonine-protein kinase
MDRGEATAIPGTEGARWPVFSPDGQWVGFVSGTQLMKVGLDGTLPRPVCEVRQRINGISWGDHNTIAISTGIRLGLFQVSSEGGDPKSLTSPNRQLGEAAHILPCFLPDEKAILYTTLSGSGSGVSEVHLFDFAANEDSLLFKDASDARYSPSGHLLFLRDDTLFAAPFDPNSLTVTGAAVPVLEGILHSLNVRSADERSLSGQFTISDSGTLVYAKGGIWPDPTTDLVWVDVDGRSESLLKSILLRPRLSPDKTLIGGIESVYEPKLGVLDTARGTFDRLAREYYARDLAWRPDGVRLTASLRRQESETFNIYDVTADASLPPEVLIGNDGEELYPGAWSQDGRYLAYVSLRPDDTLTDIWVYDDGDGSSQVFLKTDAYEEYPEWSPDGKWIAYASGESGTWEVYVRPFPNTGAKYRISTRGGREPIWSDDGKRIYYRSGLDYSRIEATQMMVVDVSTEPGFRAEVPRLLFEGQWNFGFGIRGYDMLPDGSRFLMVESELPPAIQITRLNVVQNWFEELNRLVPTE